MGKIIAVALTVFMYAGAALACDANSEEQAQEPIARAACGGLPCGTDEATPVVVASGAMSPGADEAQPVGASCELNPCLDP